MKRGFTIIEVLVASLLLGMLVSILTMMFNQSSIAWRTGVAGLMDMDEVRDNIAAVRDEADCLYIWNGKFYRTVSIWKEKSWNSREPFKNRAIGVDDISGQLLEYEKMQDGYLVNNGGLPNPVNDKLDISKIGQVSVKAAGSQTPNRNWIVNVQSSGPNRKYRDYDDIKSNPYVFR